MKLTIKQSCTAILIGAIAVLMSCGGSKGGGGDEEPTAQELALAAMEGTWSLTGGTVNRDGFDVSANYAGFTLRLTEGGYTTTNAGNLFSASGTWSWLGDSSTRFSLDDGKTINVEQVNDNMLVFSFTQGTGGSREGVEGLYRITLTK